MPASPPLLSIGSFSRLAHLSVPALRHYHELGLLEPAAVDPRTGYRRYAPEQAEAAHLIRRLRALEMPLEEVAAVLATDDPDARDRVIAAHLARMEAALDRTRWAVASLRALLSDDVEGGLVDERRHLPACRALTRTTVVDVDAISDWFADTHPRLGRALADLGVAPVGPFGATYDDAWFADGAGTVTAFVPIATATRVGADLGGLEVIELPAGDVAVATHGGGYGDLDRTYGALGRHVAEAGVEGPGPIREHYLIGPGDAPDPAGWRTEVCWPVTR